MELVCADSWFSLLMVAVISMSSSAMRHCVRDVICRRQRCAILASECIPGYPLRYPSFTDVFNTVLVVLDCRPTFDLLYEVLYDLGSLQFRTVRFDFQKWSGSDGEYVEEVKEGLDVLCQALGRDRLRRTRIVLTLPSVCQREQLMSIANHILKEYDTCLECVWRRCVLTRSAMRRWCQGA